MLPLLGPFKRASAAHRMVGPVRAAVARGRGDLADAMIRAARIEWTRGGVLNLSLLSLGEIIDASR